MRTLPLVLALASLAVAAPARADDEVPSRPERRESAEKPPSRIRSSLLIGGLGFTAGVWAVNAGSSFMFPDEPGFSKLRIPVAGPWMGLANNDCNGSCGFINYFNYVYFTVSGLAQLGGLGLALEALVTPTSDVAAQPRRRAPAAPAPASPDAPGPAGPAAPAPEAPKPTSPSGPLFYLPTPSPIGQGGMGVTFGGIF